ncbi:DUF3890 domain-containing protein [Borrelia sp. RT1S]|uniref:DUF3890 domain-containing protein n=1 Tax=Borrelia sp. RT1S TaxID=2898580 RepID=UPI001E459EA9|nr:DUF3890 domain-containing protein [Borrelia sp. RT1S]UGQ17914.1 DUF3890 domain-containing protein [Borrelia sp. RT1S]
MQDNSNLEVIHGRILELLKLDTNALSLPSFTNYIRLLEDILVTKKLDFASLSLNTSFLLIYYFIACQLIKRGELTGFTFNRIKSERLGEISVEYSDPARNNDIDSKDFCNSFGELLEDLTGQGKSRPKVLGAIP